MALRRRAIAALLLVACSRAPVREAREGSVDAAIASASSAASAPVIVEAGVTRRSGFASPPAEAERTRIEKPLDARDLAPFAKAIADHFVDAGIAPVVVQSTEIENDRRALYIAAAAPSSDAMPLVLVVDAKNDVLWTKERPLAGIVRPVGDVTIAPGAEHGVALFLYDPPTKIVAARMWDRDGNVFADFSLLKMDACDAISAAYWPRRGWVTVAAEHGVARAQLLNENGGVAWGEYGIAIGAAWRGVAPVSIVVDTNESVMFFQRGGGSSASKSGGDHLHVSRYDPQGSALWDHAVDLGPIAAGREDERITAKRVRSGAVVVALRSGDAGASAIDVTSDGSFTRH